MLRASATAVDQPAELSVVSGASGDGNVPAGAELLGLVDAALSATPRTALPAARDALAAAAGPEAVGEAAAVIGNFEMMTRIADGTGARFPDGALDDLADLREQFGLDGSESAR